MAQPGQRLIQVLKPFSRANAVHFFMARNMKKSPCRDSFLELHYMWMAIPSEASMDSWMASDSVGWAKMVAWMSSSVNSA